MKSNTLLWEVRDVAVKISREENVVSIQPALDNIDNQPRTCDGDGEMDE